jgi:regulator of sigma E protease
MLTGLTLALALPPLDGIGKILLFLVMLSILVVLHEAGHFIVARRNGVRVNDFAVGFGPTLLKWTSPRSGTNYRINLLPLGGYCAMQGEDGKTSEAEQQRQFLAEHVSGSDNFQAKAPWRRLAIVVAGPIANFVVCFLILFLAAITFGIDTGAATTRIGLVQSGTPGALAGLEPGDSIDAIDGVRFSNGDTLLKKIQASAGVPLKVEFSHQGVRRTAVIVPKAVDIGNKKMVGQIGFQRVFAFQRVNPIEAVTLSGYGTWRLIALTFDGLAKLITNPRVSAANVGGPIAMGRAASAFQDLGWASYLQYAAMLSVALGFFNLLPIPALDGGRAMFILVEMLRGRPVDPEREALVHFAGFAVLMVLIIFVAFHDVANIVSGKGIF